MDRLLPWRWALAAVLTLLALLFLLFQLLSGFSLEKQTQEQVAKVTKSPADTAGTLTAEERQVQEIVRYIEQSNPQLFNNLLGLLARDTTTIAALGASIAALTMHTLANRREPRPAVIKFIAPGWISWMLPSLSRCMIAPSNR